MAEAYVRRKAKRSALRRWTMFDTVVTALAVTACIITLFPMWYVFACSISDPAIVSAGKVTFLPRGFSVEAYRMVLANMDFWRSILNSCFYVIAGSALMLFNTIAVAYPLTRPNLKFRKPLTFYLLVQMYFGGGMIPAFILITKLGLYNSPLALILPGCFSIWNIILCRTFMASLPVDMIDAALVDGANQIQTLAKIVIPLSKPVFAVILIYTIVGIWNSWFAASIYTTRQEIQPVQLYLKRSIETTTMRKELMEGMTADMQEKYFAMQLSANQIKYTMIIVVSAPILAVYPFFQKHFVKGVMLGSLKG